MFDLVVSGGSHILPGGVESVDLGVSAGKIVAIGAPSTFAALGADHLKPELSLQSILHRHCDEPVLEVRGAHKENRLCPPARLGRVEGSLLSGSLRTNFR
jgi:hypothetical protein